MTPSDAQPCERPQKPVARAQPVGRIIPVIPRQLARPRKQDSAVKEVDTDRAVMPVTIQAGPGGKDQVATNGSVPAQNGTNDRVSKVNKEGATVNGHTAGKKNAVTSNHGHADSKVSVAKAEQTNEQPEKKRANRVRAEGMRRTKQEKITSRTEQEPQVKVQEEVREVKQSTQPPPSSIPSHSTSAPHVTDPPYHPSHTGPVHTSRPSTGSLVFGGQRDSSNTPLSSGSAFDTSSNGIIFPGSSNMQHPYSNNPAPFVDTSAQYPHYASSTQFYYQQPPSDWHPSQSQPPTAAPFPLPLRANGLHRMSRTPSQASTSAHEGIPSHNSGSGIITPDRGFESNFPLQNQYLPHQAAPAAVLRQQPPGTDSNNLQDLRRFLLDRFGSYDCADCVLNFATNRSFPAHSLLLMRSPGLQAMMPYGTKHEGSTLLNLNIPSTCYFKEPEAFIDALRYLYGGETIDAGRLLSPLQIGSEVSQGELATRMAYVLSYVAAGLTLDISDIHRVGVHVADRLLCWQTLEVALDFGLNGHFKHGMAVQHILRNVIEFIVLNFPPNFVLNTAAPQLASISRLPIHQQSHEANGSSVLPHARRPSHHRLKSIRFGDAPADQDKLSPGEVLSSVLLSLPFDILEEIFASPTLSHALGRSVVAEHLRQVVAEREKRRRYALETYETSGRCMTDKPAGTELLYLKEAVEPSPLHACGVKLVRHREDAGPLNQK